MPVIYILLAVLAALIVFVLARTLAFTPKVGVSGASEPVEFDRDKAVSNLAELVKCRTVSYWDRSLEDDKEFDKLVSLLPCLYPNVMTNCEQIPISDRALLFKWSGREAGEPAVLMAHYDVVPVEEENWQEEPFSAVIRDGVMWGRGTLDTKVTFNGILTAVDHLIGEGFVPENDVYLAFSGGEEVNGPGAVKIVEWFSQNGVEPKLVLDEGGAVVENVFPGVSAPCGLIGIAEKGMMNLEYRIASNGGHASAPKPHTPVGRLSLACAAMESHPFKYHITKPVAEMFDTLGRHSTFLYRMIFANLWLFAPVLDMICKKSGGELNALMRTTVAFTQMSGSKAPNVIPPVASMVSNMRLNPADSVQGAVDYIRSTINDDEITLTVCDSMEPSPISRTDCKGWDIVRSAVADTWAGTIVSPYLMVQCSDSRHYRDLSDKVYRFSAMALTSEERATIHGNNERIRVEAISRAAEFFIRVIKQC